MFVCALPFGEFLQGFRLFIYVLGFGIAFSQGLGRVDLSLGIECPVFVGFPVPWKVLSSNAES